MATTPAKSAFVDSVIAEIIQPGIDRLMESRYFTDLREGKLTVRRMQGFALQHYIHNMGILKAFALGAAQNAANDLTFMAYATGMTEELTHPKMCKTFGYALGLTEADFDKAAPTLGCLAHTAVCIHGMYLANVAEMRANALSNESMVQRYAAEFDELPAQAALRSIRRCARVLRRPQRSRRRTHAARRQRHCRPGHD